MYKIVKTLYIIAAAAILAAGCDNKEPQADVTGDSPVIRFGQPQTSDINLYGKTGDVSVTFQVYKDGEVPCNAVVACMTQEQLNEYEPFYTALTEDCYTIENPGLSFLDDETSKEIKVTFSEENMSEIMNKAISSGGRQLALALALESDNADIDRETGVVFWTVTVSGDEPLICINGEPTGNSVFYVSLEASLSFGVTRIGDDSECSVDIVPVSDETLSAYNPDYIAIPEDCFTCQENLVFNTGENEKEITVTFSDDNLKKIIELQNSNPGRQPVFAVSLESGDAEINSDRGEIYWEITSREIPFKIKSISGINNAINALLGMENLDKGNLQDLPVITFSSNYGVTPNIEAVYRKDLAEEYNRTNNTSYSILPEGVIDLVTTVNMDEVKIHFKAEGEIADMTAHYLVPVEIKDKEYPIDFNGTEASFIDGIYYVVLSSVIDLSLDDLYSPCTADYDGLGLVALIDNSVVPGSFWSSTWRYPVYMDAVWHHFIQASFEQPLETAFRVNFWKRNYDPVRPTKVEFWVTTDETASEDQSRWVLLDTVTDSEEGGLPGATEEFTPWESEPYVLSDYPELAGKTVRHLRFVFVTVQQGGTCGVDESASCAIGELKFWGK